MAHAIGIPSERKVSHRLHCSGVPYGICRKELITLSIPYLNVLMQCLPVLVPDKDKHQDILCRF